MESFLTSVMTSHGYLALIIFAFVEACCIPISSEITFAFAGVIAAMPHSKFSLIGVIVIGTLAEMGGSLTSYAIGRRGGPGGRADEAEDGKRPRGDLDHASAERGEAANQWQRPGDGYHP